ncbi:MAG TPA: class A beta-lactamase, subclass A2 [Flavobacteriales bacterium]
MRAHSFILPILLFIISQTTVAQSTDSLKKQLERITADRAALVGIAVKAWNGDTLSIHGDRVFPMQSVFKYHISVAMLVQVDNGRYQLNQKILVEEKDLLPGLYSPLRDKYPHGGQFTIAQLIEYAISLSDNVACDVLLRLLGGPHVVETFFHEHGIQDIAIQINEEVMQSDWNLQYKNWTTPKAAVEALQVFYENKQLQLSRKSHNFLWKVMRSTDTGKMRLKGQLPKGTVVAHKTGWSGKNKELGITAAVNDIGIVFLNKKQFFYISVFVTDSREDYDTNELIIAEVCKAVWDYFSKRK